MVVITICLEKPLLDGGIQITWQLCTLKNRKIWDIQLEDALICRKDSTVITL